MTFSGASGQPAAWQEDAFTVTGNWTPDAGATIHPGYLETGTWLQGGDYIFSSSGQNSNWVEITRQGVPFTPLNFQIAQRSGAQVFIASTGAQLSVSGSVGGTFNFPLNDPDWTDVEWLVLYTQSGSLGIDSFTINVCPDPRIWGPYTVDEGGAVLVSGYSEGNNSVLEWDFDEDGSYDDAVGISALFSAVSLDGPTTATLGLQATADCGLSGIVTSSVTSSVIVHNVAPSIDSLLGDSSADEGDTVSWTLAWSDPGSLDSHTITWDPGDGSPAQDGGDSFTHSYSDDGNYTLNVTISDDDGGSASDNLAVAINNAAPVLSGLLVPSGAEAELLSFSVSVSDPGSEDSLSYLWDFGDGTTLAGSTTAQHSYVDDGIYTVTFTASDDDGGSSSDSASAVIANLPPVISQLDIPSSAIEGQQVSVTATASDSGSDPLSFTWDFGDGSPAQTGNPLTYNWGDEGSYTVTVTVTDDEGGSTSSSESITVSNAAPSIDQGNFPGGQEGDSLAFSVQASDPGNDSLAYNWDFGDGSAPGSGPSSVHSYANQGSYSVIVVVSDGDGGTAQLSQLVEVLNAAPVIENLTGNTSGLEAQVLSWTAQVSDPGSNDTVTGNWDFGDGTSATGLSASHSFSNNGNYTVTFSATDNDGATATAVIAVTVSNEGPTITSLSVPSGDEGQILQFEGTAIDPGNDTLSYSWDFGDGSGPATGPSVSHAYDDDGNYLVTLLVTDEDNGTATATASAIIANLAPQLVSVAGPSAGEEGEALVFTATASDPGPTDDDSLLFTWDFGDGSAPSVGASVLHAFPDDGTWLVSVVTADGEGGTDTGSITVLTSNVAPAILSQPPPIAVEGIFYSYLPAVVDPGSDSLSWQLAPSAPPGAVLNPSNGRVTWTPDYSSSVAGSAAFTLVVSDGDGGSDLQTWNATVWSEDGDSDGMADGWELLNGLDPGSAADSGLDPDGDGLSNGEEFLANTDPQVFDGPGAPQFLSPDEGEEVSSATPLLVAGAAVDPQGDPLSYQFEIYLDVALSQLAASGATPASLATEASWKVDTPLPENSTLYWRARADDGAAAGPFSAVASLFVNSDNDSPLAPVPVYPLADDTVADAGVVLQWMLATDPDGDLLSYQVQLEDQDGVLIEEGQTGPVEVQEGPTSSWTVTSSLQEDGWYSWRVAAMDDLGSLGPWSAAQDFFVSQLNTVPQNTRFVSPGNGDALEDLAPLLIAEQGADPDGEIVECLFEVDPAQEFGSNEYLSYTVPAEPGGTVQWDLSATGFELPENRWVYARVRCFDTDAAGSVPDVIQLHVRGDNDPPEIPTLISPSAGTQLAGRNAILQAAGHGDLEQDLVFYEFVVARDEALADLVSASSSVLPEAEQAGDALVSWPIHNLGGTVFWSVRGIDSHGAVSEWAPAQAFSFAEEPLLEPAPPSGCSAAATPGPRARATALPIAVLLLLVATRRQKGREQPETRPRGPH